MIENNGYQNVVFFPEVETYDSRLYPITKSSSIYPKTVLARVRLGCRTYNRDVLGGSNCKIVSVY